MLYEGEVLANQYILQHFIGAGSFGSVYAARETGNGPQRRVAIKLLQPERVREPMALLRFEQHELASMLRVHANAAVPNVVRPWVPDVLLHQGIPFIVLEFIDGLSLREVIDKQGPMSIIDVCRIGAGLANGIAALHSADIIHRDVKPSNIRLRSDGTPVLLDLGIAKILCSTQDTTGSGPVLLTHRYAAPERLAGEKVGPPSDVYSLGLILFEMLTGDIALAGATSSETRILRLSPTAQNPRELRPDVPIDLAHTIQWCLARNPRARPTASQVAKLLARRQHKLRATTLGRTLGIGLCIILILFTSILLRESSDLIAWYPLDNEDNVEPLREVAPEISGGDFSLVLSLKGTSHEGNGTLVEQVTESRTSIRGFSFFVDEGNLGLLLADRNGIKACSASPLSACQRYIAQRRIDRPPYKWHRLAVTVERSSATGGRFYADGVEIGTFDPTARQGSLSNPATLNIGTRPTKVGGPVVHNIIADVMVFRRALTAQDIAHDYATTQFPDRIP